MKEILCSLILILSFPLLGKSEEATITFDSQVDRSTTGTMSKNGITITGSIMGDGSIGTDFNHTYSKNKVEYLDYMCSSTVYLIIESTVGNITKITITYSQGGTNSGFINPSGGTVKNNTSTSTTWTGNLAKISLQSKSTNHLSKITVEYTPTITMSESTYATFWCEKAFKMPAGLTGYTIDNVTNGISYGVTYNTGDIVPANTPLLLHGNAGSYPYTTNDDASTPPTPNMLVCATGATVSNDNTYYYKVSYKSSTNKTVGFYWDSTDGHSITVPYAKAYLAIPQSTTSNAKGYDITDVAAGIAQPNNGHKSQPKYGETVYDTNGKPHPYSDTLHKGIYIKDNGIKIVIK